MEQISRRHFFKVTGTALASSSMAVLGFSPTPVLAEARQFKLAATSVARQTCTYCSVGCGILMYSLGDGVMNAKRSVIHVEGDPDHPVNRGTLCPKGAGLLDFINSPNRLLHPQYRAPGSDHWVNMSWDEALDRIARLLKDDRDANFLTKTDDGKLVNRWTTTGMLAASASSNEAGYMTHKVARSWGMLPFDNQARV